jgi:membrane protein implicated in regulation of membrane protease activity
MQVPGLLIVLIGMALAWPLTGWPIWAAGLCVAAWIAKDLVLYPFVRSAYEGPAPTGAAQLIGSRTRSACRLGPGDEGWVQVRGERWRVRAADGSEPIEAGAEVVVAAAQGLLLTVAPATEVARTPGEPRDDEQAGAPTAGS